MVFDVSRMLLRSRLRRIASASEEMENLLFFSSEVFEFASASALALELELESGLAFDLGLDLDLGVPRRDESSSSVEGIPVESFESDEA